MKCISFIGDGVANEDAGMEVHQTLLKERGASTSIRGGGTLGGEEEGGAFSFSFTFTFTFDHGK